MLEYPTSIRCVDDVLGKIGGLMLGIVENLSKNFPSHVDGGQVMQHNDLDQTTMKNTSVMILYSTLKLLRHLNQTLVQIIWKIKCFDKGEMHQQPDMEPVRVRI